MSLTIQIPDQTADLLLRQADAHGLSVEAWVQELASQKAQSEEAPPQRRDAQNAIARILEIQKRVKPDPEGWTVRDYIDHGRP